MEKLLDFKKGKITDDFKMYRFQCDCLSAPDAMDIDVGACGKGDKDKFITIRMDFLGSGTWDRIKYAFAILRGHWGWREFIPRKEDYGNLANIFNPTIEYQELP